ncbi:MAG: hypothetical protein EOP04_08440 [Proteobacteria bacterium]|nr:MAG: hypothetical protein EOP04_08440 [Pseudomonadota bacterium]
MKKSPEVLHQDQAWEVPAENDKKPEENEEFIFLRLGFKKLGWDGIGMLMGKTINGGSENHLTVVPPPPAWA